MKSATALAGLLHDPTRTRPVAVITTPSAREQPWIDAEQIAREAGDLAEVYVMPTNDVSWEFSRLMTEGTQVYGGAGRVYPVGQEWIADLSKSPLRFAWSEHDGDRATQHLISDVFRMASSAGLLQSKPKRYLRSVDGTVKLIVAGRALVDIGNLMPATVAEELTVDDIAMERLASVGQRVSGWYDSETNRVDITSTLRDATEALAPYAVGDVVLARVDAINEAHAELLLYPKTTSTPVCVTVDVADVTSNPFDDLRTLLTVGEVVAARIVATAPHWELILHDVDDDEPVRDAPSLLPGGPPWLVEDADETIEAEEPSRPLPQPVTTPTTPSHHDEEPPAASSPSPRPGPAPVASSSPVEQPKQSTQALLLKIDARDCCADR